MAVAANGERAPQGMRIATDPASWLVLPSALLIAFMRIGTGVQVRSSRLVASSCDAKPFGSWIASGQAICRQRAVRMLGRLRRTIGGYPELLAPDHALSVRRLSGEVGPPVPAITSWPAPEITVPTIS
jgi:hypothetical protein